MVNNGKLTDNSAYNQRDTEKNSFWGIEKTSEVNEKMDAISNYSLVIHQNPEDSAAYYKRAEIKAEMGDYSGASLDFEKSVEISRKTSAELLEEGIFQYKSLNYINALELLSKSIELNSTCFEAFFYRGKVKSDLGEYGKAISDFDEVIRLNPVYVPAYKNRGMLRANLGDYFGAWQDLSFSDK